MTISHIQALFLAVGIMLVGIAAALADGPNRRGPHPGADSSAPVLTAPPGHPNSDGEWWASWREFAPAIQTRYTGGSGGNLPDGIGAFGVLCCGSCTAVSAMGLLFSD